jgi:hypothetical protein
MIDLSGYPEATLHIVLSTIPQRQERAFDEAVRTKYFDSYRETAKEHFKKNESGEYRGYHADAPTLYNPLRYHLLGNYDIAYISLIDNFKFTQKLFEPQLYVQDDDPLFNSHSFQCLTGITEGSTTDLHSFFSKQLLGQTRPKYFLGICNLKLNNGILIGNGLSFIRAVIEKLANQLQDLRRETDDTLEFLMLRSFSWFEISVLIFTDRPDTVGQFLTGARRLQIQNLDSCDALVASSLYQDLFPDGTDDLPLINVFADTHTYFGMHSNLVFFEKNDPFVVEFLKQDILLNTDIECQVKPGHFHLLLQEFHDTDLPVANLTHRILMAGKTDYVLLKGATSANDTLKMLWLTADEKASIYDHVRKIKTQVHFSSVYERENGKRKVFPLEKSLKLLTVSVRQMKDLQKKLKQLKVARPIRSKIMKLFSNYNNGVQDVILFPFFMDLRIFMTDLEILIQKEHENWLGHTGAADVNNLEHALMHRIRIFQEGFNIRMLNGYQFEDITDFDLDFNSSVQQLLTIYSSWVFEMGNTFYELPYKYGPIIQLNLKDTVATYSSINYYIHHLTSPEFVFATLSKEILNFFYLDSPQKEIQDILETYESEVHKLENANPYLWDMISGKLLDIRYILIDSMRFLLTYNLDFELFQYWFWTYNLQNSSLYDKRGMLNEQHFRKELFRLLFIAKFFNHDKQIKNPLPELYTFWDRHFDKANQYVQEYLDFLKSANLYTSISELLSSLNRLTTAKLKPDLSNVDIGDSPETTNRIKLVNDVQPNFQFEVREIKAMIKKDLDRKAFLETNTDQVIHDSNLNSINMFMYNYLSFIFSKNENIALLRRDWETAIPSRSFTQHSTNGWYAVDQTGGLFFEDLSEMNAYLKTSSAAIEWLWDESLKAKLRLIQSLNKQATDEYR